MAHLQTAPIEDGYFVNYPAAALPSGAAAVRRSDDTAALVIKGRRFALELKPTTMGPPAIDATRLRAGVVVEFTGAPGTLPRYGVVVDLRGHEVTFAVHDDLAAAEQHVKSIRTSRSNENRAERGERRHSPLDALGQVSTYPEPIHTNGDPRTRPRHTDRLFVVQADDSRFQLHHTQQGPRVTFEAMILRAGDVLETKGFPDIEAAEVVHPQSRFSVVTDKTASSITFEMFTSLRSARDRAAEITQSLGTTENHPTLP